MRLGGLFVVGVVVVLVVLGIGFSLGIGAWGPTQVHDVAVTRTYVDFSGSGDSKASHYMVGTDKGVFEVDNGLFIWTWNADELYAKIQVGKQYRITTRGKKVVGMFFQEYPYVVSVEPLPEMTVSTTTKYHEVIGVEKPMMTVNTNGERVIDLRENNTPVVIILKDGTKIRYGE